MGLLKLGGLAVALGVGTWLLSAILLVATAGLSYVAPFIYSIF